MDIFQIVYKGTLLFNKNNNKEFCAEINLGNGD